MGMGRERAHVTLHHGGREAAGEAQRRAHVQLEHLVPLIRVT